MYLPTPLITLRNEILSVVVAPAYGARIVDLIDLRNGRNWLAASRSVADGDGSTFYGVGEAAGWDECFPTVAPWDASELPWGRPLRDHGELWGRPWSIDRCGEASLTTSFSGDGFCFERSLTLIANQLLAEYRLINQSDASWPYLWSMHPLFALLPGERIELPGVDSVQATYVRLGGVMLAGGQLCWPKADDIPFSLDRVQSSNADFAGKFYVRNTRKALASLGGAGQWLDLKWDGVDHLGIWLAYGGWPDCNEIVHVGLEPTSAPADHLGAALASGDGRLLARHQEHRWRVEIELRRPETYTI